MDKKIAGLLGAVAALAMMDAAQAASAPTQNPAEILKASSYGDLLAPIPNAVALLRAVDTAGGATEPAELSSGVQVAQYHHHHHRYRYRRYHHHHHHHRYRGY